MSTKPRTPEHFPRMKHRAAGRIAKQQRQYRETTNIFGALSTIGEVAGQAMNTLADRLGTFIEGIRQIFQMPAKQSDFVLSPPPSLHPYELEEVIIDAPPYWPALPPITEPRTTEAAPSRAAFPFQGGNA